MPYTDEGRQLYLGQFKKKKKLPLDRHPLYDIDTLTYSKKQMLYNFEYFMNREYAYNRDKGKCKICGKLLDANNRECHHIQPTLALYKINKVPNLAWLCKDYHHIVHGSEIHDNYTNGQRSKIKHMRVLLQADSSGNAEICSRYRS